MIKIFSERKITRVQFNLMQNQDTTVTSNELMNRDHGSITEATELNKEIQPIINAKGLFIFLINRYYFLTNG